MERNDIIYVSRILPDPLMTQAEKNEAMGAGFVPLLSLHDSQTTIRLRCECIGTLESLHHVETAAHELPLQDKCVEVELAAAGLNFKAWDNMARGCSVTCTS